MTDRKPPLPADRIGPPAFAPVPRKRYRSGGWTVARQQAFIDALCDGGSVKAAAAAVGMTAESAYYLRRQPGAESFAAAWEAALAHCMEVLRDAALDRAIHGVEVPVISHGEQVGTRRVYNERLVAFMLRSYDGRMSGSGGSLPSHLRRRFDAAVEIAVARAKAVWEEERLEEETGMTSRERALQEARDWLNQIRERLAESEARRAAAAAQSPDTQSDTGETPQMD